MNFVRCPHCGLRHSERRDRHCPRCHRELDAAPGEDGSAAIAPSPSLSFGREQADEMFPFAARIAGGVFMLNALSIFYAGAVLKVPVSGPGGASSAIVDLILGALLVLGQRKVVPFCMVRVVLGAVYFLGVSLYSGDYATAAMQCALSGSLIGLLWGRPGLARFVSSTALAAGYVLFAAFVLHGGTRARNAETLLAANEIEVIGEGKVRGVSYPYRFDAPNDRWFLRSKDLAKRENPVCDQWLVRPDKDAHFLIIAEDLPQGSVDIAAYEAAVLRNLENAATKVVVLQTGSLFESYAPSRRVHARATMMGLSIEYVYGLVVLGNQGFQFIGFASEAEFPSLAEDYQRMFDSLVVGEN